MPSPSTMIIKLHFGDRLVMYVSLFTFLCGLAGVGKAIRFESYDYR